MFNNCNSLKCFILLTIFKFLRTNCAKFHIHTGAQRTGEIGMKIPKIVLNTFNGKGRIKENVFVLIPFPTLIWD